MTSSPTLSHYVAYFPQLGLSIDWTPRQFWGDSPVPLIQTLPQLKLLWQEFPFQLQDARLLEEHVIGSQI